MDMTFSKFLAMHPVLSLFTVCSLVIIGYAAYTFFMSNKNGMAALLGITILIVTQLYVESYNFASGFNNDTVVMMPDKKNLRLGEDGKLSFCVDGKARNWVKTQDGIMTTTQKTFKGRQMKCLSMKESLVFLKRNGASNEELSAFINVYN